MTIEKLEDLCVSMNELTINTHVLQTQLSELKKEINNQPSIPPITLLHNIDSNGNGKIKITELENGEIKIKYLNSNGSIIINKALLSFIYTNLPYSFTIDDLKQFLEENPYLNEDYESQKLPLIMWFFATVFKDYCKFENRKKSKMAIQKIA